MWQLIGVNSKEVYGESDCISGCLITTQNMRVTVRIAFTWTCLNRCAM